MIGKNELAAAVSLNDEDGDSGITLAEWFGSRDMDPEGVTYVADQRALRVLMLAFLGKDPHEITVPTPVAIPAHLRPVQGALIGCWLDGVAAMQRAREEEGTTLGLPDELRDVLKAALEGDSNDDDHDALVSLAQHFGIDYTPFDDLDERPEVQRGLDGDYAVVEVYNPDGSPRERGVVLGRFTSADDASAWIGRSMPSDRVDAGHYSIDGPEA